MVMRHPIFGVTRQMTVADALRDISDDMLLTLVLAEVERRSLDPDAFRQPDRPHGVRGRKDYDEGKDQMTDNIYTALAKAQSEMGKAVKDSQNPHFKSRYADLASVMNACLPALTANGIAVTHAMHWGDTDRLMLTRFSHGASDTHIEMAVPLILGKQDMQGLGSAMTYARRYGVMGLAGIAPEDDDGNAAVQSAPQKARQGLGDAWKDAVLDSLPENATPQEKAQAFAKAICADFAGKKPQALDNAWDRRNGLIVELEARYPDLYTSVVEAYELQQSANAKHDAAVKGNDHAPD